MQQPDLRQLRYFLALADELHFGRAAARIGIAQPPLTQQIQRLERLLGCQLLVRGRRTQLTDAGTTLAAEARRLIELAERTFERTRRVAHGEAGQLRVGVPPSVMLTDLPAAVRTYRERYPEVSFTLREMATSAIEEALRVGDIDLGFLREARPDPPLESSLFLVEAMVAVLPAGHRLARLREVPLRELRREPFVLFPNRLGPAFHDRIVTACVKAGFSPAVVQEATQWPTVVSLVEAGMGVSLAPECVSKLRRRGVAFRIVPQVETKVHVGWGHQAPRTASIFLAMAAKSIGKRQR